MSNDSCPLVSIIVPLYNVRDYLDACIKSITEQTYDNLEILLVDDGSTDGSDRICDEWKNRDKRIKALHKKNEGIATARNYGLDHATGDFIYWVDSDDWIDNNLIQISIETALNTNSDIVCFEYYSANDDASIVRISDDAKKFPSKQRCTSTQALRLLWEDQVQNFLWSFIAKRHLYDDLRFADGLVMEDMGITYRLYDAANAVFYLPQPLYYYRVRNSSILGVKNAALPLCTVHFIPIITDFALTHYPELRAIELNWAIRYLTGAMIWAYQGRADFTLQEYKAFKHTTKRLILIYLKMAGITHLTTTNLIKTIAVYLNCMPFLDTISRRRSERTA